MYTLPSSSLKGLLSAPKRKISPAVLATGIALLVAGNALGQAFTFTSGALSYEQNFDSMTANGIYAPGWTAIRASGSGIVGQTLSPVLSNGSGMNLSGGVYSAGVTDATDRAFGALASGSTSPAFGTSFLNNSGMNVGTISLTGVMEQWRAGSDAMVNEVTPFEYSFNASSLDTGSWTRLSSFDLAEKRTTLTNNGALDGNTAENRTDLASSAVPVLWETGTSMWIRWTDPNDTGSDALLAIDDFRLEVTLAPPSKNLIWSPTAGSGANWNTTSQSWLDGSTRTAFSTNDTVTFSDEGRAAGPTVTIDAAGVTANRVNVTNTTGTYRLQGGNFTALNGLTKTGAGTLELAAKYTGTSVVVNGGTLRTAADNRFSSNALISVGQGATLDTVGNEAISGLTLTGGTVLNASLDINGNVSALASATPSTISGNALVLTGSNRTISAAEGAALIFDLPVDGAGGSATSRINLAGPGSIRFNRPSGYSGGFTMPGGPTAPKVILAHRGALGTGELRFNGGTLDAALPLTGADSIPTAVSIGGNVALTGSEMRFTGQVSVFNTAANQNRVITVENTTTFAGAVIATTTSSISNGVTTVTQNPADRLIKAGAGTLILSNDLNTYDDGTTITDGTLRVLADAELGVGKADHSSIVSVIGNASRNVVLEIQHPNAIDDLLGVVLNSNGTNRGQLFLNFEGTEAVYALNIDGSVIAPGIYSRESVGFGDFLTGNGSLQVLNAVAIPEPTSLASLILGAGSLLGLRFRRNRVAA